MENVEGRRDMVVMPGHEHERRVVDIDDWTRRDKSDDRSCALLSLFSFPFVFFDIDIDCRRAGLTAAREVTLRQQVRKCSALEDSEDAKPRDLQVCRRFGVP